jgi:hypothetical protein
LTPDEAAGRDAQVAGARRNSPDLGCVMDLKLDPDNGTSLAMLDRCPNVPADAVTAGG